MRANFPSVFSNVYRGGSRDSLDGGRGGLNYGAEMTKEVLLRCKRINVFIV